MTAVYSSTGRRFSFELEADTVALIDAMQSDPALAETVQRFNPSLAWCVSDGKGGYLKDSSGQYITESLSAEGMIRYTRALQSVDAAAISSLQARRTIEAQALTPPMLSKGSTGQDWWEEK